MFKAAPVLIINSIQRATREFCIQTQNQPHWDLLSAVCLERSPILSRELAPLEKRFHELLSSIEFENSLKSDFEIRKENDKKQAELLKATDSLDLDIDVISTQTAQDFKDACVEELNKFQFASRKTVADEKNDLTSIDRKLDSPLVLLVKQKIGKHDLYLLPQGARSEGETMRQTAERVLRETCGNSIKYKILGNAPCGFYKYKYPQSANKSTVGAKVFFFNAQYEKGYLDEKKIKISKWLDRKELYKELPEKYCHSVKQFLIDEDLGE